MEQSQIKLRDVVGWWWCWLVGWLVRFGLLSFTVSFKLSVFVVAAAVF